MTAPATPSVSASLSSASACPTLAPSVHPTALVAPGARLGPGVKIGPQCVVGPDVVLEAGVCLHSHVVIDGHTHLASGVQIFPFASIGLVSQDLKCQGNDPTRTEIGAHTIIREHVTIHRGTPLDQGVTRIGRHCLIMVGCHIAHDCLIGDHVVMANQAILAGHVHLADHVYLGGVVAIAQFLDLGRGAMVAGGSNLVSNLPPYCLAVGRLGNLAGLNVKKLGHLGVGQDGVHGLRRAYQRIFLAKDLTFDERVRSLDPGLLAHPVVQDLHAFLTQPRRKHRFCMPDNSGGVASSATDLANAAIAGSNLFE